MLLQLLDLRQVLLQQTFDFRVVVLFHDLLQYLLQVIDLNHFLCLLLVLFAALGATIRL